MRRICRREFIISSVQAAAAVSLFGMAQGKPRVGLVQSTHKRLAKPVSPEHQLDYELVRVLPAVAGCEHLAIDFDLDRNG